jgi:hypothetical protein
MVARVVRGGGLALVHCCAFAVWTGVSCAGVRLHSVVAAPRRTCDKATKPRLGRTSPTFLRAAAGHTVMNTGGGPIGVLPARGKSRDWAQRSTKVPRRCHSSRAWVPERADGVQDHG